MHLLNITIAMSGTHYSATPLHRTVNVVPQMAGTIGHDYKNPPGQTKIENSSRQTVHLVDVQTSNGIAQSVGMEK